MKSNTLSGSKVLGAIVISSLLLLGAAYSSLAHAAQGCGHGYHMMLNGRCVPNNPGPGAMVVPGRPDCWRNVNGNMRCYR